MRETEFGILAVSCKAQTSQASEKEILHFKFVIPCSKNVYMLPRGERCDLNEIFARSFAWKEEQ